MGVTAADLRARADALQRFDEWANTHPTEMPVAAVLAAAGFLYDRLPVNARERPIDPSGVIAFHTLFRRWRPRA